MPILQQLKMKQFKLLLILLFQFKIISTLSAEKQKQRVPNFYHNSSQIQSIIDNLIKSNQNLKKRQCTNQGVTYNLLEINSQSKDKKLQAIVTCNVHARQLIATETCLEFIDRITKAKDKRTKNIADHVNFRVFYVGNQMRDSVINGDFCKRTDGNDVDINRNFPTGWKGEKQGSQTNAGPSPLSQPFSQCIQNQITALNPDIFLDIHTGQFSLYFTDSDNQSATVHQSEQQILDSIIEKVCENCRKRNDQLQGVMYVDLKIRRFIKWSNLFEIYGGYNENHGDNWYCFYMFNPITKPMFKYFKRRGANIMIQYFASIIKKEDL